MWFKALLTFEAVAKHQLQRLAEWDEVVVAVPYRLPGGLEAVQHACREEGCPLGGGGEWETQLTAQLKQERMGALRVPRHIFKPRPFHWRACALFYNRMRIAYRFYARAEVVSSLCYI